MREVLGSVLTDLIKAIIVAVLTAFVTVKLSLKQFRSQKWWEKKAEAYSEIIGQLSYYHYFLEEYLDRELRGGAEADDERWKPLIDDARRARKSIKAAAAAGAYVVSTETAAALERLLRELDKRGRDPDWIGEIETELDAIERCIATVRKQAEADLKERG